MSEAIYLPPPAARIGGRKFWKRRAIREYIAIVSSQPPPGERPDDDFLITSLEVRQMLGNVSDMWIHRHSRRPDASASAA
jgi:hypothetical protein